MAAPEARAALRRVLIVKTTSMGDVVHACAAVSDLAAACPGVEIDWLVEAPFAAIPSMHRAVRRVIPIAWRKWRKSWWRTETRAAMAAVGRDLKGAGYDLVIDLQGLLKSAWWARRAGAPVAGYDRASLREPLAAAFYARRAAVPRNLQAVDRCRRLVAAHLGLPTPAGPPDFGLRAPAPQWQAPAHSVVLIPCASRIEKRWPEDDWRALVQWLLARGLHPVVFWGNADEQALAERIAAGSPAVVPPFLSVRDAAGVLAGANFVVGLDTGLSHLGAALGRPTVGIYCDHEPGLAGLAGAGPVLSLGGKGLCPPREAVLAAVARVAGLDA